MFLLIMVVDNPQKLREVMKAWVSAGVNGVTILESTGIHRVLTREAAHPAFMGFSQMFGGGRVGHNTLFAVIESMDIAEAAVAGTEEVLGDLDKPHTGLVFALPVARTWGMPEPYDERHD